MNKNNDLNLKAEYQYHPPYVDVMVIGIKNAKASIGDDDDDYPIIWFFKKTEDEIPLFAEIHDWSERPLEEKQKSVEHISKVMRWDLSLLQSLVKQAEKSKK